MAHADLLPSEESWVQHIAGRLIDGDILVVRGLPRSGKTVLAKALAEELGSSAFYFDGSAVKDRNQAEEHIRLRDEIETRLNEHHCAQLVFDSYGYAVRLSRGGVMHSQLYGQLVDGPRSRDIGALFTSRYADALDLKVGGSPLLGRADFVELPRLDEADAAALGLTISEARTYYGETTSLARIARRSEPHFSVETVSEFVSANVSSYARDLPPDAARVLLGAHRFSDADTVSRRALRSLGTEVGEKYTVAQAVSRSALLSELRSRSPGWPRNTGDSVDRFVELLGETSDALWVDRYLYEKPDHLANFLAAVRTSTRTNIRLLGKPSNDYASIRREIAEKLSDILNIEARAMSYSDFRRLHDRHLVSSNIGIGYVLPTAGVILCLDDPGSAVAVRMPSITFDYEACWRRATPLAT